MNKKQAKNLLQKKAFTEQLYAGRNAVQTILDGCIGRGIGSFHQTTHLCYASLRRVCPRPHQTHSVRSLKLEIILLLNSRRVLLLDIYSLPGYIDSYYIPFHQAPVRYLSTPATPAPVSAVEIKWILPLISSRLRGFNCLLPPT